MDGWGPSVFTACPVAARRVVSRRPQLQHAGRARQTSHISARRRPARAERGLLLAGVSEYQMQVDRPRLEMTLDERGAHHFDVHNRA